MRLKPYRYIILKKYVIVLLLAFCIGYFFVARIYPNFVSRIEAYAHNIANEMTMSALSEVTEGKYANFSNITFDGRGYVTSTGINSMEMNRFKVDLINALQKKVNNLSDGYISVPLGALSDKEFLSGFGPKIKIKVSPVGFVKADFEDEFISCGINQVKHKTWLNVAVNMTFSSATMKKSYTVESTVPVCENIISGAVPNYYGFGRDSSLAVTQ